ncbi:MAG: radical SAM protein [Candidatus Moranbacteria bacterium]|nr:radical SAM protein [Candidatus Moranbacteria bacterium]
METNRYLTTAPLIQQHELTTQCNNACAFCYNPERCLKVFEPRPEDRERNIRIAEISVERGVMAVCPTGGEPFLVGEHLYEVMDIYRRGGCYVSINSNGRLVTPYAADRLARAGLNSALISIHGVGTLHDMMVGVPGAFPETLRGIGHLRERGVSVTPNFVATAKNIHGLLPVGRKLLETGVRAMTVTPFLPSWGAVGHGDFVLDTTAYRAYFEAIGSLRDAGMKIDSTLPIPPCVLIRLFPTDWKTFLTVHTPRVCMAGRSFGVISPDGRFRACIQAPYLDEYGGDMIRAYDRSWRKANGWAMTALVPDACVGCAAYGICGGGCRTGCMWDGGGTVKGKTMYMGEPLSEEDASCFIRRNVSGSAEETGELFSVYRNARTRDEGWGTIVFNRRNQSFTVLSKEFSDIVFSGTVRIASKKVADVLRAVGAIVPLGRSADGEEIAVVPESVSVMPGDMFLPRLAKPLPMDGVRCLRADTGERYFF